MSKSLTERVVGHSLPRYAFAGVANTIVGLSAIFAIKFFTSAGNITANLVGYIIGFIFSYTVNSRWTFRYRGSTVAGVAKFAAVTVFAYLCNLATVLVAADVMQLNSFLAQVMGIPPYALVGYFGLRFFAFDEKVAISPKSQRAELLPRWRTGLRPTIKTEPPNG